MLATVSLGGLLFQRTEPWQAVERKGGDIMVPIESLSRGLATRAEHIVGAARSWRTLEVENRELRDLNDRLQLENIRSIELEKRVRELQNLLEFKNTVFPDVDVRGGNVIGRVEPANVVAVEAGNVRRSIRLDVGVAQSVARGMPVVSHRGLVGRVVRLGEGWCDVQLITDPKMGVQAYIPRSGATGVVEGTLGGGLVMKYIQHQYDGGEQVKQGDLVYTSGAGGALPRGLELGQVIDVTGRDVDLHLTALLRPTTDFVRLDSVLVLLWFPLDDVVDGP